MQFKYTAVDIRGKTVAGEVTANDRGAAVTDLKSKGLVPTVIQPVATKGGKPEKQGILEKDIIGGDIYKKKLKPKKLLSILDQMAIMMRAGVSLSLSMEVLIESEPDKSARAILQEINDGLFAGLSISESMRKFAAFPITVISIVAAGETNGRLDVAFERAATNLAKQVALRAKIKSAMTYPSILLVLTVGLVYLMNAVVLPTFVDLFTSMGAQLPALTKGVMAFSKFITTKGHFILIGVVLFFVVYKFATTQFPSVRLAIDKFKLHMPVFGKMNMQSSVAQFCTIMNSLVESGVEIVASLEIAREVVPNTFIQSQIVQIIEDVKVGTTINKSMAATGVFDPLLISMIRVGEESGALDEVLGKMANLYENQTDESVKNLTALMEPAMTVVIAVVVGTVVISIVQPMFGMYAIIK